MYPKKVLLCICFEYTKARIRLTWVATTRYTWEGSNHKAKNLRAWKNLKLPRVPTNCSLENWNTLDPSLHVTHVSLHNMGFLENYLITLRYCRVNITILAQNMRTMVEFFLSYLEYLINVYSTFGIPKDIPCTFFRYLHMDWELVLCVW